MICQKAKKKTDDTFTVNSSNNIVNGVKKKQKYVL